MELKENFRVYECTDCGERMIIEPDEQSPEKCPYCESWDYEIEIE